MTVAFSRSALVLPLFAEAVLVPRTLFIISSAAPGPGPGPTPTPSPPSSPSPVGGFGDAAEALRWIEPIGAEETDEDEERVAAHSMGTGLAEIVAIEIALNLRKKKD
jgi:hypothetical protein